MARLKLLRDGVHRLPSIVGYLQGGAAVHDKTRAKVNPLRKLYGTARWQRLRWDVLVRDEFTCKRCGVTLTDTSQLVADHIRPHRGDEALFWDKGNLQCLCAGCHNSAKQAEEARDRAAAARGGGV